MASSTTPKGSRLKCYQCSADFQGKEHKTAVLKQLEHQRKNNILTDVVLKCNGGEFFCHQNVLAAASQYFRGIFTSGMRECDSNVVSFTTISEKTMKILLDYMYCGSTAVPVASVQELGLVLEASHMLQLDSLFCHCCKVLVTKLAKENFILIMEIAEKYNEEMKNSVIKYIARDLLSISTSEEFPLLNFAEVLAIFNSQEIRAHAVVSVIDAILKWAKQDLQRREQHLDELLACVEIQSLAKEQLKQLLEKTTVWESPALTKILLKCISQRYFEGETNVASLRKQFAMKPPNKNLSKRGN